MFSLAQWDLIVNVFVAVGTIGAAVAAVLAARSATNIAKEGRNQAEKIAIEDRRHAAAIAEQDRRHAAEVALNDRRVASEVAAVDRREANNRESRQRRAELENRLIDDALALLETWEQCWRLSHVNSLIGAMGAGAGDGYRQAQAHLGALLRASRKLYPRGMVAYEGSRAVQVSEALKGSDKEALLAGGERARQLIRHEILRIIDSARADLVKVPLQPSGEDVADNIDEGRSAGSANVPIEEPAPDPAPLRDLRRTRFRRHDLPRQGIPRKKREKPRDRKALCLWKRRDPRGRGFHPRAVAMPGQAMVNLPIRLGRTMF